jgi:predicted nucleic acid-binding protein
VKSCTVTKGADPVVAAAERIFLDTNLIVAATVEVHPAHAESCRLVDTWVAHGADLCLSLQVCREFLVVLTRQTCERANVRIGRGVGW